MQPNYSPVYYVVTIETNGDIKGCPYEQFNRNAMASKLGVTTTNHEIVLSQNKELQETVDLYYEKLVELGAITKPKTQEEIQKEQAELINKQAAAMDEMLSIIKELKASTQSTPVAVPTTSEPVTVENPLPVVVVEDKPVTTAKAKGAKK